MAPHAATSTGTGARLARIKAALLGPALAGLVLAGCSQKVAPEAGSGEPGTVPGATAAASNTGTAAAPDSAAAAAGDPRWRQTFAEATRAEPPSDWPRPPDTTAAGKSVGKLYTDVTAGWKEIAFVSPSGKPIEYSAELQTEHGRITIGLRPDLAPNHVKNFVALARAGYYDGLVFERIIHQVSDVAQGVQLDLIEGGGPLGVADPDYDGIGYWLKSEADPRAKHEEGTVGAARGEDVDTAACKFYIITGPVPDSLNGNYTVFGKVTHGIDVARKIHRQPVIVEDEDGGYHRPEKPVVIEKVTIHAREADASVASVKGK